MASRGENTLSGAGTGALVGGAAGSVLPGVGTAIGAGVGAVGGGLYGYFKNKSLSDVLSGAGTDVTGSLSGPMASLDTQQGLVNTAAQWGTTGNGPSAAQAMLERERAAANARALGQAKSMAGGNPALQATLASNTASSEQQGALNQATALRAQEQQAALNAALTGQNNITQGQQGVSNAKIAGDEENNKRNGSFFSKALGGLGGGIGGMFG
jgi:hypothetical protein